MTGSSRRSRSGRCSTSRTTSGCPTCSPDQGQRRRRQRCAGNPQQRAPRSAPRRSSRTRPVPRRRRTLRRRAAVAGAGRSSRPRAHREQRGGEKEAADVHDPQQLRTARHQISGRRRHCEVQHRQIWRVEHGRKREHDSPIHSRDLHSVSQQLLHAGCGYELSLGERPGMSLEDAT
jgi:hypothetical protein